MTEILALVVIATLVISIWLYTKQLSYKKQLFEVRRNAAEMREDINSSMAFFYMCPQLGIDECSPALIKLLEIDKNLNLKQLRDFFRPKNPGILGQLLTNINDNISPSEVILQSPNHDKKLKCSAARMNDSNGRLKSIVLYFQDVSADYSEKHHIDELMQDAKDKLDAMQNILDASPYPMWKRDSSLRITYANKAYFKLLGMPTSEKEIDELHSTSQVLAQEAIGSSSMLTERKHLVLNGERRLYKISEVPIDNTSTMGFARDISEQEEIEEELERNIASQSHFLESTTSATAIYGRDQKLLFYNNAFVSLWGLSDAFLENGPTYGEILDKLRENRKLPEQIDFKAFKDKLIKQFNNQIDDISEEFFYLPDGKVLRSINIPHESGGMIITYEDVTDKLALEESYNTLIAVKRATIDNLHEGIAVLQEDGRLNLFNPIYAEIWQLETDFLNSSPHISEVLDRTSFLYKFDNEWEEYKETLIKNIMSRETSKMRLSRKDGSVFDWTCVPLPDGNTLMTYIDITDSFLVEKSLRSEKEALKEADNLKSNFLANVSYELRSPLTSIRGFSEALLQKYFGDLNDKQLEYVKDIYSSSLSLTHLINDILDMASINAGYMKLNIEKFDLSKEVESILRDLENKIKSNNRKFVFKFDKSLKKVEADKARVLQIINNLIANSLKNTDEGNTITLEIKKGKKCFEIIVSDDAKHSDRDTAGVFEEFYDKKSTGNESLEITSLALPIVKSFVELHDGQIDYSYNKDVGSRIKCTFNDQIK